MKPISLKSKHSKQHQIPQKTKAFLQLTKIGKTYPLPQKKHYTALQQIDLNIASGEFICLIGKSGSGKTTLLNLLSGLAMPTSGELLFQGHSLQKMSDQELSRLRNLEIGFIFQDFNLLNHLNLEDNIWLPRLLAQNNGQHQALSNKAQLWQMSELLKRLEIATVAKHLPHQVSGGQKQRAAIGRALINSPSLILADEPTGNLDLETGLSIINLLKEIHQEQRITLIIVTHDLRIAKLADRVLVLENGYLHSNTIHTQP